MSCVFLGYPFAKKGYKLYNLETKQFIVSRDVVFHEDVFPFSSSSPISQTHVTFPPPSSPSDSVPFTSPTHDLVPPTSAFTSLVPASLSSPIYDSPSLPSDPISSLVCDSALSLIIPSTVPTTAPPADGPLTRSNRTHQFPPYLTDYVCHFPPFFSCITTLTPPATFEPTTYSQVAPIPAWQDAMRKEFEALEVNHTWDIVALPGGKKPIGYVNNVFLHGDLDEEVYMKLSPGLSVTTAPSSSSSTLGSPGHMVIIVVYVDDIILTGDDLAEITTLKSFLDAQFKNKDLEVASVVCPLDLNSKLKADYGDLLAQPERYRSLVGKLLFLTRTRPDICFGVQHLSQFLQSPRVPHMFVALHILRYLKGTPDLHLFYSNSSDFTISAYSNSDWVACPDTRRSVTGFCVFLGDSLISESLRSNS
ncbi:uncharacterized protein LOC142177332 [Nicotiana tabacum]|uniref:Uncharacterized protein LOC142177332 n=1 Tax=Nicotiana tabacum TaxID=4097 RepID=A0AC58TXF8_TOBAC